MKWVPLQDFMTEQPFSPLPDAELIVADLDRNLPYPVREALLNVILSWADLDMATAFFVSSVSGLSPDDGAGKYGRKEIADKLKRAASALQNNGQAEAASKIGEIAEVYPRKAIFRRRIAHSRCAGVLKSVPHRVVFMPFEREGPPGNLAIEIFDLSEFLNAFQWAKEVHDYLMQHVDAANFFDS